MLNKASSVAKWEAGDALVATADLAMDCLVPDPAQERVDLADAECKRRASGEI